jgi:ATP-binding cassette subfamily C (CFTR/MRP) protein 1
MRVGLVEMIFDKMLKLSYNKKAEFKVMTLMISDMQSIMSDSAFMHEVWAAPLELTLVVWLSWRQVGPSSLTVLGVAIIKSSSNLTQESSC